MSDQDLKQEQDIELVVKTESGETRPLEEEPIKGAQLPGATPELFAGRFEIDRLLGQGGMARVFKAVDHSSGKTVALKVITPERLKEGEKSIRRLEQEAKAVSVLSHPNIGVIREFGQDQDGAPYLVMDYLDGTPLSETLRKQGAFEINSAIRIISQVCDGLAHAHARGVIHRDIKPSNILKSADDHVHIVDFGIARVLEPSGSAHVPLTETGEMIGTPWYMSPEQCFGQAVDARSDIYQLGCLLYELLTGKPPYEGATSFEVMYKHVTGLPGLESVSPALQTVLVKALDKNPENRYQTIEQFKAALETAAKSPGGWRAKLDHRFNRAARILDYRFAVPIGLIAICLCLCAILVQHQADQQTIQPAPAVVPISSGSVLEPSRVEQWKGKTLADYDAAIENDTGNADLYYDRGTLHSLRNERPNAIADFTKAITFKPSFANAYIERAVTFGKMSEFDKALADANKAIEISPNWSWAYLRRGTIENQAELYDRAVADLTKAISLDPNNATYYTELARAYDGLGNYDKAVELATSAMRLPHSSYAEYAARGLFYLHKNDLDKAIADMRTASSGNWPEPFNGLALIYARQGKIKQAIKEADNAISLENFPARGYRERGDVYFTAGLLEKAIEDYGISIGLEPTYAPTYRKRAICYLKLGQARNALEDLKNAVRLNPNSKQSSNLLVLVQSKLEPDKK